MHTTDKLLRVFQIDRELRGLQSSLRAAERFLTQQNKELDQITAKTNALNAELKKNQAVAADHEGEMARLDARIAQIRTQMETAKTNKEYQASLTELNNLKSQRDEFETKALEIMTRVDAIKKDIETIGADSNERQKVRGVAASERDQRAAEIRDRVEELKARRAEYAAEVPADAMSELERLVERDGDSAMAPIELIDRRRHEFNCGGCQMSLPVESVSGLLSTGRLTHCVSCGCLLYLEESFVKAMQPAASKR